MNDLGFEFRSRFLASPGQWSIRRNGKQPFEGRERESFLVSQLLIRPGVHVRICGYADSRIAGYNDITISGVADIRM